MATIRRFTPQDANSVADLFQAVFRKSNKPAPQSLADYFVEIYCNHPWTDAEIGPLVYLGTDERIRGFIGINVVPMNWRGRRIRAAYAGSLMVDAPDDDPLAGARLLRSFLNGPQDISISETANATSFAMWQKLGGEMVPSRSFDWVRVLRPLTLAATAGLRRLPLLGIVRPATAALDRIAGRVMPQLPGSTAAGRDVDPMELDEMIIKIAASYALHPAFDRSALEVLIGNAVQKEDRGPPLARLVHDRRGQPIGGYLAHGDKHGVLRVLQTFTTPASAAPVLADLLGTADRIGASGVAGIVQPEILGPLQVAKCLYLLRCVTVVHSRDPELLAAAHSADSFLNGIGGETWMRTLGGRFE